MSISYLIYKDMLADKYVKIRFKIVIDIISPFIKQTSKILDIGCYTGDLLKFLPSGIEYYGVDNDKEALKIAKERGAKVFNINLENESLSFKAEKFDIILATEVLEHLKDPEKLVLQIKNLVKENGVVLISLPNECTIYHRLKVLFGKGIDGTGFAPHYHLHFPTVKQNDEFVNRHFKIIKKCYWVHLGQGRTEKFLSIIPLWFWEKLAEIFPGLFARGVIYLCQK